MTPNQKTMAGVAGLIVLLIFISMWIHTSMQQIDTAGAKPPQKMTAADYAQEIQSLQKMNMPQGLKQSLIARIQSEEHGGNGAAGAPASSQMPPGVPSR